MHSVLFLTGTYAPFQIELALEVNRRGICDYFVGFAEPNAPSRGRHWLNVPASYDSRFVRKYDGDNLKTWAIRTIKELDPEIVVVGGLRGPLFQAVMSLRRTFGYKVGIWAEQPTPAGRLWSMARDVRYALALRRVDFVWAVGYGARDFFERGCADTTLIPYGEALDRCFAREVVAPDANAQTEKKVRFLFSGQLIERHHISLILQAICRLYVNYGKVFTFTFSASGPLQHLIDSELETAPALADVMRFDSTFETWSDRLNPFLKCDVFVYPSAYSGWGLVVPEAMACGVPVISTSNVEASRFFIEHEKNGLLIEPIIEELVAAMARFIKRPDEILRLGSCARASARKGNVDAIADKVCESIERLAG